jgi:hypothetical protein
MLLNIKHANLIYEGLWMIEVVLISSSFAHHKIESSKRKMWHLFIKIQLVIFLNIPEKGTVLDQDSFVQHANIVIENTQRPALSSPSLLNSRDSSSSAPWAMSKARHTTPCLRFIYKKDESSTVYSANISVEHFGGREFISHSVESRSPFRVRWSDSQQNSSLPQANKFYKKTQVN